MILPEDHVLLSQDPVPEDLNDWPDFTLTDAKVRVAGRTSYASLLDASVDYPLSVTGRLSRLDNQHTKLVIHPKYTQIQLRIENCTHYAFGQDPSGKSVVWAAGKAGWYEIIPSARYAPVYEDIVKAIDLIYFLSDTHQKLAARRPVRGAKVDELLALYQQHTDYRVDDNAEAEAVLGKHHSFLMRQMSEGWEGINWARTHLWSYFSRLYPDEVANDAAALAEEKDQEEGDQEEIEASEDDEPPAKSAVDHDGTDWVDVIFREILQVRAAGPTCQRHCSVHDIAKTLVRQYSIASRHEASNIIRDAAESLLHCLDADPDQGANRSWSRKVVYHQLQRLAQNEHEGQGDERMRGVVTPVRGLCSRRHQKSILRPSAAAGKGRKRILRAQSPLDDDNEEVGDVEDKEKFSTGMETPTKKKRVVSATGNSLGLNTTKENAVLNVVDGRTSDIQQAQLDLIRKESIANGRLHVNHLEALIEGLIRGTR